MSDESKCILCAAPGPFRRRFMKDGYGIAECPSCGLVQLEPTPAPETLRALYETPTLPADPAELGVPLDPTLAQLRSGLVAHRRRLWLRRSVRRAWYVLAVVMVAELVLAIAQRLLPLEQAPLVAAALPVLGLFYGLHHWAAAATGGMVNAHLIVIMNTALESPLVQISMVPMLAWIANSAACRFCPTPCPSDAWSAIIPNATG